MAAQKIEKKMRESLAENEKRGRVECCSLKIYYRSDCLLQTLTLAYIRLRAREIRKKKLKLKAITRVEMRKTKNGVIFTQKQGADTFSRSKIFAT